jgi:hypothetical protein
MLLALALGVAHPSPSARSAPPSGRDATRPPPFASRLQRTPLRKPLVFNAGFGDYRGGHFHAGFDLGTRRRVGRPVVAPERGWIERVRISGVGYGRALYLRTPDARMLQFGHLDAFAGPLGRYVQSAQDSSGRYEQDLWLSPGQFRVRAGEIIAWSGESGAGGPHLHFEIRRGDIAYNPQRAGLAVADRLRPELLTLTLEPLDDTSLVEDRSGPFTVSLSRPDTVSAIGRLRAVVVARDRLGSGSGRVVPWSVGIEWDGRRTECRFDSVSWATDMPEADYVYDAGRVTGSMGLILWSPAGVRPRVLHADAPVGEDAGTIEIRSGDPPRVLHLWARDLAGGVARRRVVVRPGRPSPPVIPGLWRGEEPWSETSAAFTSFPGGFVRVSFPVRSAKRGLDLQMGAVARRATQAAGAWSATFSVPVNAALNTVRVPIAMRAADSVTTTTERGGFVWARRASSADAFELKVDTGQLRVGFPAGALFEETTVLAYGASASGRNGLVPLGSAWQVEPSRHTLRRAARVRILAPAGASLDRVGLYRLDSGSWQWVGDDHDSDMRTVVGDSRSLGRFALFRDEVGPYVALLKPSAPPARAGPYSRWAVEASVVEKGSGVDARASWIEVDGVRVPTEWDPEAGRLRWRPAKPPGRGTHAVLIVAADRAGNTTRTQGQFRLGR